MNLTTTAGNVPDALRTAMVDFITAHGYATSEPVAAAMRTVPRHKFVPGASVEDAYANVAVITKNAANGAALSCASVPTVVAMMLDQLDIQPGNRVLEIGAGTGYNAALMAHLAGPDGQITTVDIDGEVTAQARDALDATGYEAVTVITRDGALAAVENAPYDRVIFTVGPWDIPAAIWDQLAPGGRLVVPLRWRGEARSVAFTRDGEVLRSVSIESCGFVPMVGQEGEHAASITADDLVSLVWDNDQSIDPALLDGVLDQARQESWSGVMVGKFEPFDGIWLRLGSVESGTCRITADQRAVEGGLCKPAIPIRTPALVDGASLAYLATRRLDSADDSEPRYELGVIGHGVDGQQIADRFCAQIRAWGDDRNGRPQITVYRAGTRDSEMVRGHVIDKTESRLVLGYTTARG